MSAADSACPCPSGEDPGTIANPPGQSAIAYRAGDFSSFRRALLRPRADEQAIGQWRPAPGDLGLAVLEWWAYIGDVLTFYNQVYANEAYLRTATQPASVSGLAGLLGYRPAPGLAATGSLALMRKPGRPAEPLAVPAGMRVASVASPGVPSQIFEVDPAATFDRPSALAVDLPPDPTLRVGADGTVSVLLSGRVGRVKTGDELLLVDRAFDGSLDNWSVVSVSAITPVRDPVTGRANTLLTLSGLSRGWQSAWWLGLLLGSLGSEDGTRYRLMRPTRTTTLWNQGGSAIALPRVHLSGVVRSVAPGDLVLLDQPTRGAALGMVTQALDTVGTVKYPAAGSEGASPPTGSGGANTPPDIVIAHTALTLSLWFISDLILDAERLEGQDPTVTVRYGFTDVGEIIGVPATSLPSLPATVLMAAESAPAVGATALLGGADGSGVPVIVADVAGQGPTAQVQLQGAGTPPAQLGAELPVPLALLVDVVGVSRGKTVADEVLGSGNATLANQAFTLAKSPLTYLPGAGGPVSTLSVFVDGIRWQEAPSFYGQSPDARVYVVTRSADQAVTTITFGDGIDGGRLPSRAGNVRATYRYGSGAVGPPAGRLTTILEPQPNLASIQNPVAVSGGADPQAPDDIRTVAPGSVSGFGGAVSASDYELIAARTAGVARAAASWQFAGEQQRTVVTVYVGDDDAAVSAAGAALAATDQPGRPVSVRAATPNELSISCTLAISADREVAPVVTAAGAAILDLFSARRMGIGQPLYRSEVAAALTVPGVAAVQNLLLRSSDQDVFDPGPGGFFVLAPGALSIEGVTAGG